MNINVIARSDSAGTDVLGSSGSPITIPSTYTLAATQATWTVVRDFRDVSWVVVAANDGLGLTRLDVKIEWAHTVAPTPLWARQGTESISAGVSTLSEYEAQFSFGAVVFPEILPVISLPVAAPYVRIGIKGVGAGAGVDATAYVQVWRKA